MNFHNIPDELKTYNQFVLWRLVDGNKVPWCPHEDRPASSTAPGDWGTFQDCLNVGSQRPDYYAGIGFVLSKNDPFGFIDLDNFEKCKDRVNAEKLQRDIQEQFDSYTEFSPSGTGLHIIVRTPITITGAKSSEYGIEVYTAERFMTMTGNIFRDAPIKDQGELFHTLWGQIKARQGNGFEYLGDYEQSRFDEQVIELALRHNEDTFKPLYNGDWQSLYASQSEADFAFMDIIAFYSKNYEQTKRIFKASALYRPEKYDRREDHLDKEIQRAFDRVPPPVDIEANAAAFREALSKQNEAAKEKEPPPTASTVEPGKSLGPQPFSWTGSPVKVFPPGLVGQIAQFIYDAAPRPVREVALAGAIGFFAGITGRAYNVSATGLNQYVMLLARTGRGKEAIKSGTSRLMHEIVGDIHDGLASASLFEGPASFSSAPALTRWLAERSPSIVSIMGEVGITIKRISAQNASTHDQGLTQALLDLWTKSGRTDTLNGRAYSDKEKDTAVVKSPAFSIVGESNPLTFYEGIDEHTISTGLLPRFMIIEYTGERVKRNKENATIKPTSQLINQMRIVMMRCLEAMQNHTVTDVQMSPQAEKFLDDFDDKCDEVMNNSEDRATDEIWNRAHLKALKLAALVAVGIDPIKPTVDIDTARWAVALVEQDAKNIVSKFQTGQVGAALLATSENEQMNDTLVILRRWYVEGQFPKTVEDQFKQAGIVPYRAIAQAIYNIASFRKDKRGQSAAFSRVIEVMKSSGYIVELSKHEGIEKFGTRQRLFQIISQL